MKYDIQNRYTGEIQFTADFDCADDVSDPVKIGLAVRWAIENDVDLSGANLRYANLSEADLSEADLTEANLRGANLSYANLHSALLSEANLHGANLRGANLREADLTDANLCEANLSGAYLSKAHGILRVGPSADGYEFFGVVRDNRVWIKAGCRWFTANFARTHWNKTRSGTSLGAERIRFVNFIEAQMLLNKI